VSVERSTIFPFEDGEPGRFYYARYDHPSGVAAEEELGRLEGGHVLLFASGAAASTAALLGLLAPGATVALAEGCYYGTPTLLRALEPWGLRYVEFDQRTAPPNGVDLVWLEAPSNPFLTFPDMAAARAHPAPVLVDATASTPALFRPLEHGADVVLHSATKFLAGHHDALLGALVFKDRPQHDAVKKFRGLTGAIAAPDAAYLLRRSLKTLHVRVERESRSALELARRLSQHPAVQTVRYPGLGDPLAARYMQNGFGGMLSFDVADAAAAHTVETNLRRILNATSLGGVDSSLESRRRWEGERVPAGLLRLSVGLEDVEELWADLERALALVA
jgi:cystathionine gamma-synthase